MNAFDIIGNVDTALASVYQTLFEALNAQALALGSLLILLWITYLGISFILKKEAPSTKHLWRLVVMSVYLQFALKWGLFSTFWLPVLTNWPFEAAGAIVGTTGGGGADLTSVFGAYTTNVFNALSDKLDTLTWREIPQIIVLAAAGYLPIVLMTGWVLSLIIISKIAIATVMVLLPIFTIFGIFEATQNLFVSVIRQLLNFMLIPILLAAVLLISSALFDVMAADLSATSGLKISNMIMFGTANLAIYQLLKQVPLIAAGIAGGMLISGAGLAGNVNGYMAGRMQAVKTQLGGANAAANVMKSIGAGGGNTSRPSNAIINATQSMNRNQ